MTSTTRLATLVALAALALGTIACDSKKDTATPEAKPEAVEAPKGATDEAATGDPAPTEAAKAPSEATPTPAPTGSADAATGPCADFKNKVCEAAGPQSEHCSALGQVMMFLSDRACTAALEDLGDVQAKLADLRKVCDALVTKLCGDIGNDTKTCAMVKEKTPEFPTARCQQMMDNYEEVIGELRRMEKMNQPLSAEEQAKLVEGDVPSWGPKDAKVVIVEFSDFECPYCTKAAEVEQQLKEKYSDKVRFVFRQFPLSFHKNAMPAAIASMEAHAQGKFWPMHDGLFTITREMSREGIEKIGEQSGLDMAKLKAALDSEKYKAQVEADMELGQSVGVQGTPTMFINGERVQNPTDFEAISKQIDELLAKN